MTSTSSDLLRCTILGCATSIGVPVLGCPCENCTSTDPRDNRTRCSILVDWKGKTFLIDTGPDLRQQLIRESRFDIDHVLITHTHADHIFGLDDLRPVHFLHKPEIQVWGRDDHLQTLQSIFPYAFTKTKQQGPVPRLTPMIIEAGQSFSPEDDIEITALTLQHGDETVFGYRFGSFAYLTDVSGIPEDSATLLSGVDTLVLGALRNRPHAKHFSVDQAIAIARELGVRHLILTHLGHELGYQALTDHLPAFAQPAYDGMVLEIR